MISGGLCAHRQSRYVELAPAAENADWTAALWLCSDPFHTDRHFLVQIPAGLIHSNVNTITMEPPVQCICCSLNSLNNPISPVIHYLSGYLSRSTVR